MADDEGFQVVTRKRRNKHGQRVKGIKREGGNDQTNDVAPEECDTQRTITRIQEYRNEIQASNFYSSLRALFLEHENGINNAENPSSSAVAGSQLEGKNTTHPIGSFSDIVCYGVGCISTCPTARYQFALLLLLKDNFKISDNHCCIYEPHFKEVDKHIVRQFGCSVTEHNEEGKKKVSDNCLFFMLHCGKPLYNNLLWANWGPELSRVVILGNAFSSYQQRLPWRQLTETAMYIAKVLPYTKEIAISNTFRPRDIFNDSALHFFPSRRLLQVPSEFWTEKPEPMYDVDDPEIITAKSKDKR